MAGNKLRLYIAFYARNPTPNQAERYHIGFFLTPKNPYNKSEIQNSTVYHVVNSLDPKTLNQKWKFEGKIAYSRTVKLMGLMLLGKVPSNITKEAITEVMSSVPVEQASDWWCHDWVLAAMPALVTNGIIPTLPDTPRTVWQTGRAFVDANIQWEGYRRRPVI